MSILGRIKVFQQELEALKEEYRKYIADTSVPLDERWAVFKEAPSDLKDHEMWCFDFKCVKINWYDDFYVERHETVNFVDFIANIEDDLNSGMFDETDPDWATLIPQMKEEILAANCGSFCFDW